VTDVTPAPPPVTSAHKSGPWRRAITNGLWIWAIAHVAYLIINAVFWTLRSEGGPPPADFFDVWNRWDTGHYIYIASNGYNPHSENPAFFPLYPLLMAGLDPLLPGDMLATGLIISSLTTLIALIVIFRLVDDLFDGPTAERTILYLMAFPFAFFLVAAYNESLLVVLTAGALYCMRRGHWWGAGLLTGLASGARMAGLLLALAFVIEYLRQRQWHLNLVRWDALWILLSPAGLIGFMIYDNNAFGDPLRFMHQQSTWGRNLSSPWEGIAGAANQMAPPLSADQPFHPQVVLNAIDVATVPFVILLLVLAIWGPWRLGAPSAYLIAYGIASFALVLIIPMGDPLPPLHGLPRFTLENPVVFIMLARFGRDRRFERAYLLPAMALQAALLIGFFANVWLA
jgi:hypothetical protein